MNEENELINILSGETNENISFYDEALNYSLKKQKTPIISNN